MSQKTAALDFFANSLSFDEARARFLACAEKALSHRSETERRTFLVPSAKGEELPVDYLHVPARSDSQPRTLVAVVSGVHGMEGFAGSAVQSMLLTEFASRLGTERVGALFVHALNPFGFRHHRRTTENNVNLNRNILNSSEAFSDSALANPGYEKLRELLEPERPASAVSTNFVSLSSKILKRLLLGELSADEVLQGVAQGQFDSPKGLEFGGFGYEPQTIDFISYFKTIVGCYEQVLLFDLHTGWGETNQLHLMPADHPRSVDAKLFSRIFNLARDRDIYRCTPNTSQGFYKTNGDLNNVLPLVVSDAQPVVGVTLEFGTLGTHPLRKLDALNRLVLENQGYHHGFESSRAEASVKRSFIEFFFPSDREWRRQVVARSQVLFGQVFEALETAHQVWD